MQDSQTVSFQPHSRPGASRDRPGASLECLVCGEFLLERPVAHACLECGALLCDGVEIPQSELEFVAQAG